MNPVVKPWWDVKAEVGSKIARLRQNAVLLRGTPSLYWPLHRDDNSRLWPYAIACLEATLKLSDIAITSYAQIVEAWELPGCQDFQKVCINRWPRTRIWWGKVKKAYANRAECPELPSLASTYEKYKDNPDFNALIQLAAEFVLLNFNCQQDVLNETYKVIPTPNLCKAIAVRSMIDYAEYDAVRLRKYRDPEIERIMMAKPKPDTRKEREIRHQVTNTYRTMGHKLTADNTLLDCGKAWYKCRVNPGTIEGYLDELAKDDEYLERSNIETAIAPCDEATGYPRKWRK